MPFLEKGEERLVRSRYRIGQVGVPYETKKKGKKIRGRKELAIYQSILYIYIYIYRFVRLAIIKIIKYIFHNMANDTIHSKLVNHGVAACLTC
jgi:hypothetical protein